jgi:predicted Zn-dependent protease
MRRRNLARSALAAVLLSSVAGTVAAAAPAPPPPGYRPALNTTEGGLWAVMDQAEADIRVSPALVKDEGLNAYVKKIVCDLAGPQCDSLRVYIVEDPTNNALTAPNGMVVVWTGLLLRVQSEAELAFVLGHEITHYLKRHSVTNFEKATNAAGRLRLLTVATLGAAALPAILIAGGLFASYSRDQEREADIGGFDLVVGKGYDPKQGALFMTNIAEERDASANRRKGLPYLESHPQPEERAATINKRAAEPGPQASATALETDPYRAAIASHRAAWLEEEFNRGDFGQSITMINQLLKADPGSAELRFFLGEAYRRRNAKGDIENATKAYQEALAQGSAPAAAYRGLGLVSLKSGQNDAARRALEQYLMLEPQAGDRDMVQFYLTGIKGTP